MYLGHFLADLNAINNRIVLSNTFYMTCIFGDVGGSVVEQWSRMLLQLMCGIVSLIIFENNVFQYLYCAYRHIIMWCRKIQIQYVGN